MRAVRILAAVAGLVVAAFVGVLVEASADGWAALGPEREVAAMPGVGQGWIDTLRLVSGFRGRVDTVSAAMVRTEGDFLLGVTEYWHDVVNVRTDMRAYARFVRGQSCVAGFGYQHPATVTNPPGVVAHEFGHAFAIALWPHGLVREGGDSLPTWAQGNPEEFADRFARAMLALRGWDDPDRKDVLLNHVVRTRLVLALAGGYE